MVNERYSIAISETLHYLKGINQKDIDKIPNKFMIFLKENASNDYYCDFDYTKPLKELNLTKEARGIISMICLNYWCETEEQKTEFKNYLSQNEKKYQEELRKKYSIDDIFKKEGINNVQAQPENVNELPVKIEKENIFKRIFNFIKKFF